MWHKIITAAPFVLLLLTAFIYFYWKEAINFRCDAWIFSRDNIIDFLSVCIGVNAASSIEKVQSLCLAPVQNKWQTCKDSLQVCLDEYTKQSKKLQKRDRGCMEKAANPSNEMKELSSIIEFHTGIINKASYLMKMISRGCIFFCIALTIPSQAEWLKENRSGLVLFLLPPLLFFCFAVIYWLIAHFCIDNNLEKKVTNGCDRLHSCIDMINNIKKPRTKYKTETDT